jgi:hypothetical protein
VSEQRPTFCKACGAHVRWCVTETGKKIPVDWLPDDRGKLVLHQDDGGQVRAYHEANAPDRGATPVRYVAHFATCDTPDAFRKPRSAA